LQGEASPQQRATAQRPHSPVDAIDWPRHRTLQKSAAQESKAAETPQTHSKTTLTRSGNDRLTDMQARYSPAYPAIAICFDELLAFWYVGHRKQQFGFQGRARDKGFWPVLTIRVIAIRNQHPAASCFPEWPQEQQDSR